MNLNNPIIRYFSQYFCTLMIDNLEHTYCIYMTAIVLSMGIKFANKEEIVSDTRSEDSVTLLPSSLRVFTGKCIVFLFSLFVLSIC